MVGGVELILLFAIALVALRRSLFTELSAHAIIAITCTLILLVSATSLARLGQGNREDFLSSDVNELVFLRQLNNKNEAGIDAAKTVDTTTNRNTDAADASEAPTPTPTPPPRVAPPFPINITAHLNEDVDRLSRVIPAISLSKVMSGDREGNAARGSGGGVGSGYKKMTMYYSVYSPISFHQHSVTAPPQWRNLLDNATAPLQVHTTVGTGGVTGAVPTLPKAEEALKLGMPLDERSSLVGPSCSEMGLTAKGAWTVFVQIRFGRLTPETKSPAAKPLDILTLFTASQTASSTQGLVIRLTDTDTRHVIQTARLTVNLSNNNAFVCKIDGNERIPFDTRATYTLTVVKTASTSTGHVTAYLSSSVDPDEFLTVLDTTAVKPPDDFINLPLVLNNNKSVNARVLALGAYDGELSAAEVKTVHDYLAERDKQMRDRDYLEALRLISQLESKYRSLTACPLAQSAPNACRLCADEIKNWGSFSQVALASDRCRTAIAEACSSPNADPEGICACWNRDQLSTYQSPACENLRAAFESRKMHDLKKLGQEDLDRIKLDYDSICPKCPTAAKTGAAPGKTGAAPGMTGAAPGKTPPPPQNQKRQCRAKPKPAPGTIAHKTITAESSPQLMSQLMSLVNGAAARGGR